VVAAWPKVEVRRIPAVSAVASVGVRLIFGFDFCPVLIEDRKPKPRGGEEDRHAAHRRFGGQALDASDGALRHASLVGELTLAQVGAAPSGAQIAIGWKGHAHQGAGGAAACGVVRRRLFMPEIGAVDRWRIGAAGWPGVFGKRFALSHLF